MWELMLRTEQFDIYMDEANLKFELRLKVDESEAPVTIRMSHADLTQLLHTLLEIHRSFRGEIPFFHTKQLPGRP